MPLAALTSAIAPQDLEHILSHTPGIWEGLRGQRIFITGGTGFFGCWLLESFIRANDQLQLGAQAAVLTRSPRDFTAKAPHLADHPAITLLQGDVRTFDFPAGDYCYVIHAATDSLARFNPQDNLLGFDTIVAGTRRVLEFARSHGTQKFLLTSSGAVYGKQPEGMTHIPEDYAGAPDTTLEGSAFGEGKRAAEMMCTLYAHPRSMQVKIARCFAFTGAYLPFNLPYAIGNFIRDALNRETIKIEGDGTPYRSYLYAADLAIWLWTILCKEAPDPRPGVEAPDRAYNVGSDKAISIVELAGLVRDLLYPAGDIAIAHQPVPGMAPARYIPAIEKAANELGLKVWVNLDEAILRTAVSAVKYIPPKYRGLPIKGQ
jgi:dTDP-glucose 4,6-dehydratase